MNVWEELAALAKRAMEGEAQPASTPAPVTTPPTNNPLTTIGQDVEQEIESFTMREIALFISNIEKRVSQLETHIMGRPSLEAGAYKQPKG